METAMVLAYLFGFLFISFQIGLIAYYQLSLDAAAELQARYVALAGADDAGASDAVNKSVPNVRLHAHTRLSSDHNPAQIDTSAVDGAYGMKNSGQRQGGYSFTVPVPKLTRIGTDNKALFILNAVNVPLSSFAVAGAVREICVHACIGQGGTATSSMANSVDYRQSGDDVVPYFMSFNFMRVCGADQTTDLAVPPYGTADSTWTTCPALTSGVVNTTSQGLRALGTAAHLDSTNDGYQLAGMQLSSSYTANRTDAPDANEAGPFFELWCHRRFYLAIKYYMDLNQSQRPQLEPATLVDTAYNPAVPTPYLRNRNKMTAFFDKLVTPGKPGGDRPDSPGAYMDYMYYSAPGHANAGWDAYPLNVTTNYRQDPANTLTPWFGCGAL